MYFLGTYRPQYRSDIERDIKRGNFENKNANIAACLLYYVLLGFRLAVVPHAVYTIIGPIGGHLL